MRLYRNTLYEEENKSMQDNFEAEFLNNILHFQPITIPESTHFWMIRTQKGYFYNEFISRGFVALAWNNIDECTDFTHQSKELLKDDIIITFPEIKRPSTVINKCNNFINKVKENDILVIPSKGSQFVTFALAGEYFEDESKTVDLEKSVIYRIKNNDVDINDVSCPYKKRRKISVLRTIKSDDVNVSLYRAISNYHGISNLDDYSYHILNELYNCYTYKNYTALVYNVRKATPIKPRELSSFIYANTECLCTIMPEDNLSIQTELHSPGDIIYFLKDMYSVAKDNWGIVLGLLVMLGGGSALSFKVPGLIDIIKNALLIPQEIKSKKLENDTKEVELQLKRLELQKNLKDSGINPESLITSLDSIIENTSSLRVEPINLENSSEEIPSAISENEESTDIDEV